MYTQITKYIAAFICICLSSTSFAAWKTDEEVAAEEAEKATAYVDSVHHWGAWELDIEPAAGGITPATTQPLSDRGARVSFRTNSFSAVAPASPAPTPVTNTPVIPTSGPTSPTRFAPPGATPATTVPLPSSTNIGSVTPSTTVPAGTGGLF